MTEHHIDIKSLHSAITATLALADSCPISTAPGISLLLVRPQLLLNTLHHLVLRLGCQLTGQLPDDPFPVFPGLSTLSGNLVVNQEILTQVRNMEIKLEYQIKKLSALADTSIEADDPLSFKANVAAIAPARPATKDEQSEVYRPPRVAAVPYNPVSRRERKAPALLSEFATSIDGAPVVETTAGLSTVANRSNSTSAKRAAELERIQQFEHDNMTRLVTSKREAKRRREDEAALALGYGVGRSANRQNGLEAELDGVLGDRRSKGVWEGVSSKFGERRKHVGPERRKKKTRFEKEMRPRN